MDTSQKIFYLSFRQIWNQWTEKPLETTFWASRRPHSKLKNDPQETWLNPTHKTRVVRYERVVARLCPMSRLVKEIKSLLNVTKQGTGYKTWHKIAVRSYNQPFRAKILKREVLKPTTSGMEVRSYNQPLSQNKILKKVQPAKNRYKFL